MCYINCKALCQCHLVWLWLCLWFPWECLEGWLPSRGLFSHRFPQAKKGLSLGGRGGEVSFTIHSTNTHGGFYNLTPQPLLCGKLRTERRVTLGQAERGPMAERSQVDPK